MDKLCSQNCEIKTLNFFHGSNFSKMRSPFTGNMHERTWRFSQFWEVL